MEPELEFRKVLKIKALAEDVQMYQMCSYGNEGIKTRY